MEQIKIDVYADVVCPWCYVGGKRLEKALEQRPDLAVELRWQPYQLRPDILAGGLPWHEFAVDKFGGEDRMRVAFSHVSAVGEPDGLRFDFDRIASAPNTVDAHRLILYSAERDLQWKMATALFRSYFTDGANLNDHEELIEIATRLGLGFVADEVRGFLKSGETTEEVWVSQKKAAGFGVAGVPFYVFDSRYALSGAQPAETFVKVLDARQNGWAV